MHLRFALQLDDELLDRFYLCSFSLDLGHPRALIEVDVAQSHPLLVVLAICFVGYRRRVLIDLFLHYYHLIIINLSAGSPSNTDTHSFHPIV